MTVQELIIALQAVSDPNLEIGIAADSTWLCPDNPPYCMIFANKDGEIFVQEITRRESEDE